MLESWVSAMLSPHFSLLLFPVVIIVSWHCCFLLLLSSVVVISHCCCLPLLSLFCINIVVFCCCCYPSLSFPVVVISHHRCCFPLLLLSSYPSEQRHLPFVTLFVVMVVLVQCVHSSREEGGGGIERAERVVQQEQFLFLDLQPVQCKGGSQMPNNSYFEFNT